MYANKVRVYQKVGPRKRCWVVDYYVRVGGRLVRRQERYPTKERAELAKAERTVEMAGDKYQDRKKSFAIPFAEAVEEYVKWAKANKLTWLRDRQSLDHWCEELGGKRLNQVSRLDVERHKQQRRDAVSPRTLNEEMSCLRRFFYRMMEMGFAESNPVKGTKFLREPPGRVKTLSTDEVRRLLDACPEHLRPVVVTALHTGMRQGEIVRLEWGDVDFGRNVVVVRNSKNGERREIPMTATLRSVLEKLPRSASTERVFRTPDGEPYVTGRSIRETYQRAVRKTGIRDLRFHDLRHVFATNLRIRGADLFDIKEYLGHKVLAMTLRYAHITTERKQAVIRLLDGDSGTGCREDSPGSGELMESESKIRP